MPKKQVTSKAKKPRSRRQVTRLGAEPVAEDADGPEIQADAEAASSQGKAKRTQSVADKVAATLARDFPWADHHTKIKECGNPPLTLEARLRAEYLPLEASQRISKQRIKEFAMLYAPKDVVVQFPIKDKSQALPPALKEALDTFQDTDLRTRSKVPLKLQLSLMTDTNQMQVALICEVLTKTKATSNPDQAAAICEFARTIKRLSLEEKFPEECNAIKQTLSCGLAAQLGD